MQLMSFTAIRCVRVDRRHHVRLTLVHIYNRTFSSFRRVNKNFYKARFTLIANRRPSKEEMEEEGREDRSQETVQHEQLKSAFDNKDLFSILN
jgi:hypothetical protein